MPKKISRSRQPATKADIDKAVEELAGATQKGFSGVDERFEVIDQRFDAIDQRFDAIDQRFEVIDQRFEAIDQRFEVIERDIIVIKKDVTSLKKGQGAILEVVKSIDRQLKTHKDLPVRVARLERAVFR